MLGLRPTVHFLYFFCQLGSSTCGISLKLVQLPPHTSPSDSAIFPAFVNYYVSFHWNLPSLTGAKSNATPYICAESFVCVTILFSDYDIGAKPAYFLALLTFSKVSLPCIYNAYCSSLVLNV